MSDPSNPYGQPPQYGEGEQPPAYGAQPPAYGQQPPAYGQQPPYGQQNAYAQPSPYVTGGPVGVDPDKRPGTVTAAGVVTLVLSGITAVVTLIGLIALGSQKDEVLDELRTEPGFEDVNPDDVYGFIVVLMVVVVVWCLIAMVLAVLAMRRSNVARILLVISSAMAALLSLIGIFSLVSAVPLIAAVTVMVLLLTGRAREWYARKGQSPQLPLGTTQPWS